MQVESRVDSEKGVFVQVGSEEVFHFALDFGKFELFGQLSLEGFHLRYCVSPLESQVGLVLHTGLLCKSIFKSLAPCVLRFILLKKELPLKILHFLDLVSCFLDVKLVLHRNCLVKHFFVNFLGLRGL